MSPSAPITAPLESARPKTLADMVGQQAAKAHASIALRAATKRGVLFPHTLITGPSGVGKTTLGRAIAHEQGASVHLVHCPALATDKHALRALYDIVVNDLTEPKEYQRAEGDLTLLLDEIHALPLTSAENLYPLLEQGILHRHGYPLRCDRLTVIGMTTHEHLLPRALLRRFRTVLDLQAYEQPEVAEIVTRATTTWGFAIQPDAADQLALASWGEAGLAVQLAADFWDLCEADDRVPDRAAAIELLASQGRDAHGLTGAQREYLKILRKMESEPLGLNAMAMYLRREERVVEQSVEPPLLRAGFIQRTPRGRKLTREGFAYVKAHIIGGTPYGQPDPE